MSTTEARVDAVSAVQTSEILEVLKSINSVQPKNTASTRRLFILPKYCQHSKYSSCPSVNLSCKQMGMKLSNQCINDRSVLHTPSILRIFGVLRGFAVPTDEMRPVRAVPAVLNPKIRSIHSIEPRALKYCCLLYTSPSPRD